MAEDAPDPTSRYGTKIGRLVDEYDLDGLGEELHDRWNGDGAERMSLRQLADYFNEQLLEAAVADTEAQLLDGQAANLYELLTDDARSAGDRAEAEGWLERAGVPPDALRADFVSHQTVYNYLKNHRNAEYDNERRDDAEQRDNRKAAVQRLRGRLASVSESTIQSLASTGAIETGEIDVFVNVRVYCNGCDRQYEFTDLLDRGGCACGTV